MLKSKFIFLITIFYNLNIVVQLAELTDWMDGITTSGFNVTGFMIPKILVHASIFFSPVLLSTSSPGGGLGLPSTLHLPPILGNII